jgi:hypothetical protein
MAYGTINADVIGTSVTGSNIGAGNASIMKNRIINGAMVIDQRNAGASITPTDNQYSLDRWRTASSQTGKYTVQQNAGSVTTPTGFTNYAGITSTSAYTVLTGDYFLFGQLIEGFNFSDLQWGTANAKTVTLSFQVYSSLTGNFGGSLRNSASNRSYPFSYSVPVANTWTSISITVAGDTSGTWIGATNGTGLNLQFSLGVGATYTTTAGAWAAGNYANATGATSVVGTNGATFYITGVQLEVGSSATGYEYRQYTTELALCQRYFEKSYPIETAPAENIATGETFKTGIFTAGALYGSKINFVVTKRASPTMTYYRPTQSTTNGQWAYYTSAWNTGTGTATGDVGVNGFSANINASLTGQNAYIVQGGWTASSEL